MREYLKSFMEQEEGVESMEWLAIVVVAAAMIGVAIACGDQIKGKLSSALSFL